MSWPATQAEREQRLVEIKSQRAREMTLADIAWRHDISHARVRQILERDRRRMVGRIEVDLQEIEWMLIDRLTAVQARAIMDRQTMQPEGGIQ